MQKRYNFPTFDEMTSDSVHPVEPNVDENVVAHSEDRRIVSIRIILIRSVDTVWKNPFTVFFLEKIRDTDLPNIRYLMICLILLAQGMDLFWPLWWTFDFHCDREISWPAYWSVVRTILLYRKLCPYSWNYLRAEPTGHIKAVNKITYFVLILA